MLELEIRDYTRTELSKIMGPKDNQALERKLERYEIEYAKQGDGKKAIYSIHRMNNLFKMYCVEELKYDCRTNFHKLMYFFYYYFNDDEFLAMPDEVKEQRMTANEQPVSRQTIANYSRKLEKNNLVLLKTGNYIYYFAYQGNRSITDEQTYKKAWREYWKCIHNGGYPWEAIWNMRTEYGGVARKQNIPEVNGIFNEKIEYICSLAQEQIERQVESRIQP